MTIYDITFSSLWNNFLPVNKRQAIYRAIGGAILYPLQWLRNLFFDDYANGSSALDYDALISYVAGNRVRYIDRSIYEAIQSTTGNAPINNLFWIKVQDIYIGIRERAHYNSQIILMEFALNRWFMVAPIPADQIYINILQNINDSFVLGIDGTESSALAINSTESEDFIGLSFSPPSYSFAIYVPIAVFNTLAASNPDRESIIRSVANKWVLAGITYSVITY